MKIVLASQSPRRRQLLGQMGLEFTTQSPEIDEAAFQGRDARDLVQILSREKARWIAGQVDPETLVIGADTVVVRDGEILGKPKGEEEARAMLADPLMVLVNHTSKMPDAILSIPRSAALPPPSTRRCRPRPATPSSRCRRLLPPTA